MMRKTMEEMSEVQVRLGLVISEMERGLRMEREVGVVQMEVNGLKGEVERLRSVAEKGE